MRTLSRGLSPVRRSVKRWPWRALVADLVAVLALGFLVGVWIGAGGWLR